MKGGDLMEKLQAHIFESVELSAVGSVAHPTCSNALVEDLFDEE